MKKQLSAWKEAADIRAFIHELLEQAANGKESKLNVDAWCQWAEKYVASISPAPESFPGFEEEVTNV